MIEDSTNQLRRAVEAEHGGKATFVQSVLVHESFREGTVWDGTVTVFDLQGSPSGAFRAYAWPNERPDGKRGFVTILHTPIIVGPRYAVRAAVVAEQIAEK